MEFRPNVTGILASSKVEQSVASIVSRSLTAAVRSQTHSAFALCVRIIFWISVSLGSAILVFKPSRENKCRGTEAI